MQNSETPTRSQLCSQGFIDGDWDIGQLIDVCEGRSAHDLKAKRLFKRYAWSAAGSFALVLLICVVSGGAIPSIALVPFLMCCVFLVLCFVYRAVNMPDEARVYLVPLLSCLRDDIKTGSSASIHMKLKPLKSNDNLTGKSQPYQQGAYSKIIDYTYDRQLLQLAVRLHDGNKLMINCHQQLVVISKTKKNPRGKIKTKTKYKARNTYTYKLLLDDQRYALSPLPAETISFQEHQIELSSSEKGNCLKTKTVEKAQGPTMPNYEKSVGEVMVLYACLQALQKKKDEKDG